jgi:hypothetical protein
MKKVLHPSLQRFRQLLCAFQLETDQIDNHIRL